MAISEPPVALNGDHPEEIDAVASIIFDFIEKQGRPTRNEIRAYCKDAGVPTPLYQKGMERLDKQGNMVTEVTNEDGQKAWTIKEWARGHRYPQLKELIAIAGGQKKPRENFTDWYVVKGIFRLQTHALASQPDPQSDSSRVFLRGSEGIVLLDGYYQAMLKSACGKAEAPSIGNARFRVQWDTVTLPVSAVGMVLRPVPPSRPGGSGQGVTSCESLAPSTEIPFCATVPGSHVDPAQFETLLIIAGKYVGFSPAASHKGWGRFTPIIGN